MIDFGFAKARPIGLDIGHNSVKMIQFSQKDGHLCVLGADKIQCKTGETDWDLRKNFLVNSIIELTSRCGFSGGKVVACLPNDSVSIGSIRFDISESDQIEELVKSEVSERLGFDADRDEIQYMIAGKVHQGEAIKTEVIYFATDRQTIERYISVIEDAGLIPVALDPIPCAMIQNYRSSMRRESEQDEVNFLVDIGSHSTTVLIGSCQQISFIKQIPLGGSDLNKRVAGCLNISSDEAAMLRLKVLSGNKDTINQSTEQLVLDSMNEIIDKLVREISLCFHYYSVTFRGARPKTAILSGGESYETHLVKVLASQLGIDTIVGHPLRGMDLTKVSPSFDTNSPLCEWTVATGLGVRNWNVANCETQIHERN